MEHTYLGVMVEETKPNKHNHEQPIHVGGDPTPEIIFAFLCPPYQAQPQPKTLPTL